MKKVLNGSARMRAQRSAMSTAWWIVVVEWTLAALMLVYFGLHTLPAAWKTLNTDFSNYYLTARLAREKSNTSRIYEWIWLQRQKDHRDIEQRIISLVADYTGFDTCTRATHGHATPLLQSIVG